MKRKIPPCLQKIIPALFIVMIFSLMPGSESFPGIIKTDTVAAAGDFIYFPYPVYTVSEDCQTAEIMIMRKRTSLWLITADFATSDVTATAGSDYTSVQGTKTMTMFLTDTLTVPVNDDSTGEIDEEFTITLSGQYTLDDPSNGYYRSCTVVIVDNDGGASLSDNNLLESLEISEGNMYPSFSGNIQNYETNLEEDISSISVRAFPEDNSSEITLGGEVLQAGVWSSPVALSPGQNTANIIVEAENGDFRTYMIIINRDIMPAVDVVTQPLDADGGNMICTGSDIEYEGFHTIAINDTSTTGWGWKLLLYLDEYIESVPGVVDDPVQADGTSLEIDIPADGVCFFNAISITKPDQISYQLGNCLDPSNASVVSGRYIMEVVEETSGVAGLYTIHLEQSLIIPPWLPEGTRIGSSSESGYTTIQPGDMKQIYAGPYTYGIYYGLERIMQP